MNHDHSLQFVSSYRDRRSRGGKRFLFWVALAIHAGALLALIVVPLMQVDEDVPPFESVAAFLVRPAQAPPPPPAPAPAPAPRTSGSSTSARPRLESSFIAPVAVPDNVPMEDFGSFDAGIPGGVDGGVPGGMVVVVVVGLSEEPTPTPAEEPVRLDFRSDEARPITRVDPVYPDLAARGRVQGVVVLEVLVDARGVPASVTVLKSIPLLEEAAIDAVRQWRWNPYRLLEKAVPFWVTVTVNFRLT